MHKENKKIKSFLPWGGQSKHLLRSTEHKWENAETKPENKIVIAMVSTLDGEELKLPKRKITPEKSFSL